MARGRPTLYKPEYTAMAEKIALLGATDRELGEIFEVSEVTINEWKKAHPEFSLALKKGKAEADAEVVHSLYRRATGYRHKVQKVLSDAKGGYNIVEYEESLPPDTTAAIFWLKNRQSAKWRDRQEVNQSFDVLGSMSQDNEPVQSDEPGPATPVL